MAAIVMCVGRSAVEFVCIAGDVLCGRPCVSAYIGATGIGGCSTRRGGLLVSSAGRLAWVYSLRPPPHYLESAVHVHSCIHTVTCTTPA